MTIRSMTGFAREAGGAGSGQWAWEAKTVNGRGLDIRVRTPPGFDELGEAARKGLATVLARGQAQVTLTINQTPGPVRVRINREVLEGLLTTLRDVERPASIGPATLDGLLAVRGVVEVEEEAHGSGDILRAEALAALPALGVALAASRESEGRALSGIAGRQVETMTALVDAAETCPARQPDAIRQRLAEQVGLLVNAASALDPARLHAEAALLATRADILEEIDRLRAHLDSVRDLLAAGGPVGRKLDFLAQELGREANTLCSKANDLTLSRIGLDLKAVVEQFREQVQNVE